MNKIWIPGVLFLLIIGGGLLYNSFLGNKADELLNLADMAYEECLSGGDAVKYLDKIDKELEKISGMLCAFLDRDIINDAEEYIVYARELAKIKSSESRGAVSILKEKIRHIKNSATIELKYILFRGEVEEYVAQCF